MSEPKRPKRVFSREGQECYIPEEADAYMDYLSEELAAAYMNLDQTIRMIRRLRAEIGPDLWTESGELIDSIEDYHA